MYSKRPMISTQESVCLATAASSPVPKKFAHKEFRTPSSTMLSAAIAANFASDLDDGACTAFPGSEMTGRGEPGGLVIDLERGLRPGAAFDAGVAGGGMPLASALLDTLWDFLLLEPAIDPSEEDAKLVCGCISGEWSGLTTVVASSTRSPNIGWCRKAIDSQRSSNSAFGNENSQCEARQNCW